MSNNLGRKVAVLIAALLVIGGMALAQDYDAQIKGMQKCERLSNRATELAWEVYRRELQNCADMPDRIGEYTSVASMKARDAKKQCSVDTLKKRERTIEDIMAKNDECVDAAQSL